MLITPSKPGFFAREFESTDIEAVKIFTDSNIGSNYFSRTELKSVLKQSVRDGINCSFVLERKTKNEQNFSNRIIGVRLSYAPGMWKHGKGSQLRPDLWGVKLEQVGYFQSLFVDQEARGEGWGPKLSELSLQQMRKLGAKAVVTHAWAQSPDNSSVRYLEKFGFQKVIDHPEYWINVDYTCTYDGKPCRCTAVEMIKHL